ncbi:hypothetical protein R2R35_23760 [Anaerocolumna sp. AGMB13020]|uniref:hypothetical protein n=1 Tax=Anaerocolumna sp. AGMB13020 TaxID=3081750 RepID=UPI002954538B|nr:hypothetical protein [Anaerocolumna sp. AGMB13020]WOO36769.1 hypothetical protein R2R35_23760 [Anaerocolumna sp. AGMB13020]
MYWTFYDQNQMIDDKNLDTVIMTMQALVDVIIPRSPELAREFGIIQYYGGLDEYVDEYMVLTLQNQYFPLAAFVVDILDTVAYLRETEEDRDYQQSHRFFEASEELRLEALGFIREYAKESENIPPILADSADMLMNIYSMLIRFPMMGFYSEWSGYGSTRLYPPSERVLQYRPVSWEQIDYPGPSNGYHALRSSESIYFNIE